MRDKAQKRHNTEGGDTIADYIRADTTLPAYLPYPRFLLKMEISQTAKLLYALLLDRSTLSQKNGWQDGEGRIFIVYPVAEIAEMLDKGCTAIKGALKELDAAGLLATAHLAQSRAAHSAERIRGLQSLLDFLRHGGRPLCEDCGEEIPLVRLLAAPGATRCRECQQMLEDGEGGPATGLAAETSAMHGLAGNY